MLTVLHTTYYTLFQLVKTVPLPHPISVAISAYCLGCCLAYYTPIGIALFLLYTISLLCAYTIQEKNIYTLITTCLISTLLGIFLIKYQIEKFDTVQESCAHGPYTITLEVKNYQENSHNLYACSITGTILVAQQHNTLKPCNNLVGTTIMIYCTKQQNATFGDIIQFCNITCACHKSDSDFARYLLRSDICATSHTNEVCAVLQERDKAALPSLESIQRTIVDRFATQIQSYTKLLFNSIFLGHKNPIERKYMQIKQWFRYWGIEHYLARSGLHMALLALVWTMLISCIPCSLATKNIIVLAFCAIYGFATIPSISFARTFLFFCACRLLGFFDAPLYSLHIYMLIMFAIILHNPFHIFFLDFQLSFILAGALVWIHAVIQQKKRLPA